MCIYTQIIPPPRFYFNQNAFGNIFSFFLCPLCVTQSTLDNFHHWTFWTTLQHSTCSGMMTWRISYLMSLFLVFGCIFLHGTFEGSGRMKRKSFEILTSQCHLSSNQATIFAASLSQQPRLFSVDLSNRVTLSRCSFIHSFIHLFLHTLIVLWCSLFLVIFLIVIKC